MISVVLLIFGGIAVGYMLRNMRLSWIGHVVTALIWCLLFVLGLQVGGNREIVDNFARLGGEAIFISLCGILGSALFAKVLWKRVSGSDAAAKKEDGDDIQSGSLFALLRGSIVIVGFFVAGVTVAMCGILTYDVVGDGVEIFTLGALMFAVGVSVGNDDPWQRFRSLTPLMLLLPLCTILGTVAGSALGSVFLPWRSATDCLAVGSGLAYYSLSSIFITEYKGAELGTVALLANLSRELITLLAAPLLVRWFGKFAAISSGGATTMDTTLPVILSVSGKDMVAIAVFHGFVCDFSVPFVVTLWCSL